MRFEDQVRKDLIVVSLARRLIATIFFAVFAGLFAMMLPGLVFVMLLPFPVGTIIAVILAVGAAAAVMVVMLSNGSENGRMKSFYKGLAKVGSPEAILADLNAAEDRVFGDGHLRVGQHYIGWTAPSPAMLPGVNNNLYRVIPRGKRLQANIDRWVTRDVYLDIRDENTGYRWKFTGITEQMPAGYMTAPRKGRRAQTYIPLEQLCQALNEIQYENTPVEISI